MPFTARDGRGLQNVFKSYIASTVSTVTTPATVSSVDSTMVIENYNASAFTVLPAATDSETETTGSVAFCLSSKAFDGISTGSLTAPVYSATSKGLRISAMLTLTAPSARGAYTTCFKTLYLLLNGISSEDAIAPSNSLYLASASTSECVITPSFVPRGGATPYCTPFQFQHLELDGLLGTYTASFRVERSADGRDLLVGYKVHAISSLYSNNVKLFLACDSGYGGSNNETYKTLITVPATSVTTGSPGTGKISSPTKFYINNTDLQNTFAPKNLSTVTTTPRVAILEYSAYHSPYNLYFCTDTINNTFLKTSYTSYPYTSTQKPTYLSDGALQFIALGEVFTCNIRSPRLTQVLGGYGVPITALVKYKGKYITIAKDMSFISTNGTTWAYKNTSSTISSLMNCTCAIVFNNVLLMGGRRDAVGLYGLTSTTDDTLSSSATPIITTNDDSTISLASSQTSVIALCNRGSYTVPRIWRSTNGSTFTAVALPSGLGTGDGSVSRITYGNGMYVIACRNKFLLKSLDDGITWSIITPPGSNSSASATDCLMVGNRLYVSSDAIKPGGAVYNIMYTEDLTNFSVGNWVETTVASGLLMSYGVTTSAPTGFILSDGSDLADVFDFM